MGGKGLDTEIFEWETQLAADKGRQPNTSKRSTQDQNELRKGIFIMTLAVNSASCVSEVAHIELTWSTG
jgi:hypothetical protein